MSLFSYFLLLGSNQNNPENMLSRAREMLKEQGLMIDKSSRIYRTAAWGNEAQPDFLNQALAISTALEGSELMQLILETEELLGRVRAEKWGPRVIDIDILAGPVKVDIPGLILPHPALTERRFALVPLAEIAPELVPPGLEQTVSALLEACTDPLPVQLYL